MDFLILRPLSPKTRYHFFEGVGVGVGGGAGVKSFRSEGSKQWGSLVLSHNHRSNGNTADAKFFRILVGRLLAAGCQPPTKKTPVCITIRPLLGLRRKVSALLGAASATDKKPKLCVSV